MIEPAGAFFYGRWVYIADSGNAQTFPSQPKNFYYMENPNTLFVNVTEGFYPAFELIRGENGKPLKGKQNFFGKAVFNRQGCQKRLKSVSCDP